LNDLTKISAFLALTLTSVASAIEVSSIMTNTTHKFYLKVDNITKVNFEITAKRFIEDYTQLKKKSYFFLSHLESTKITKFFQGTLYLKNTHLRFNQAFWSQGELVLKGASGVINQKNFNAPELRFNKRTMAVTAKNVTFKSANKISRKLNFNQQVEALTYPYQKVPFYNSPQINRIN